MMTVSCSGSTATMLGRLVLAYRNGALPRPRVEIFASLKSRAAVPTAEL
jgi:hypothetical protein